jgi:DDE domain
VCHTRDHGTGRALARRRHAPPASGGVWPWVSRQPSAKERMSICGTGRTAYRTARRTHARRARAAPGRQGRAGDTKPTEATERAGSAVTTNSSYHTTPAAVGPRARAARSRHVGTFERFSQRTRERKGLPAGCQGYCQPVELGCGVAYSQHEQIKRAVDQDGHVLDIFVQGRRDKVAAKTFFRKLLKRLRSVPRVIVTDQLQSYGAAKRVVLPRVEHRQHRYVNNHAENSHQPTRQRERCMQG